MSNNLVFSAYKDAVLYHGEQVRKETGIPYLIHVLKVVEQLALWGIDQKQYPSLWITMYLHDTVEDTEMTLDVIEERYGSIVAEWVKMLSFRNRKEGESSRDYQTAKSVHLDGFADKPIEVVVGKLADRFQNTLDFLNSDPKYAAIYLKDRAQGLTSLIFSRKKDIEEKFGFTTYQKILETFCGLLHTVNSKNQ